MAAVGLVVIVRQRVLLIRKKFKKLLTFSDFGAKLLLKG